MVKIELRDNLADLLHYNLAEEREGTLETMPADTVAAKLGFPWQATTYQVRFTSVATQIIYRSENSSIAANILSAINSLESNLDSVLLIPIAVLWPNTYALSVGDRRVILSLDQPAYSIIVHLIGHWRELYKRL